MISIVNENRLLYGYYSDGDSPAPEPKAKPMARPRFLPVAKSNKTATFITFPELPGAVFIGTPSNADLDHAIYMQDVFADYVETLCQVTLHAALRRIGWGYDEIMAAVMNPATLTSCVYLSDVRDIDLVPALIAA
jgi:hypothetical protein